MKILITGGTGFIGSVLARRLIELGHHVTITGVSTECSIPKEAKFLHLGIESSIDNNLRQDCIFHLASNNDTLCNDKEEMFRNNFLEPIKLFDKLYKFGCRKFIYASSTAVYGNSPAPYEETTPINPLNVYAESKFAFEQYATDFASKNKDCCMIGLRYCNVYGFGEFHKQKRSSMIYQMYQNIKKDKNIRLFKYGEQKRDWCYVEDVVEATTNCLLFNKNEIFNIANGKSLTFNYIAELIGKELNKKINIEYIDCDFLEKFQNNTECDIEKAKKYLNWKPKFTIEEGIEDYIKKLEEHFTNQN
jgi:ADP-L-glycero-D-manno-heptose 6-epimerase